MLDLALPIIAFLFADGMRRRGAGAHAPIPGAHEQPTVTPATPAPRPQPRPQPAPGPRPQPAPAPRPPGPPVNNVSIPAPHVAPPAWPSAVPSDLPPFPGPGWMPHPSPGRVASRASALLPQLWARGEGTHVVEQTAGEWVAYQAKQMGAKKGVVAYVPRSVAPIPASNTLPRPPVSTAPAPRPRPPAPPPSPVVPQLDVPEIITASHVPEASNRPTLSVGSKGAYVVDLQKKLGVVAKGGGYTGYYGTMTEAAVSKFQAQNGLPATGIVDSATWDALGF